MSTLLSRRRFIGITAAATGLSLLPIGQRAKADAQLVTWQGQAMGAAATLQIHHHDRAAAMRLIERSLAEMRHLEQIFSLYRDDSVVSILNRQGMLVAPPIELVKLLTDSRGYADLTGGAFDPTVQALWTLYRDHFTMPGADPNGPNERLVRSALAHVNIKQVLFDRNRVAFARPGVALTFNGIAQGYATDRVVEILRGDGIASSLVDMGESRVIGARVDGTPWRIGIADPEQPERIAETLDVVDRAVATSGGYGFRFDSAGRFNHLLDPRTGGSANLYRSVTVLMPTATAADALSTAFSLMPISEITSTLREIGSGEVHLVTAEGERRIITA